MGGFSDPPLGDAAHTEEFLQRHPQSALRPSLELFSSTAGFERNTESRKTAAAKSVTLWRRLSASKNLVVQAIATEIDSSDYLYLPITATRITDISSRRPATGYRPAGLSATGPPITGHWSLVTEAAARRRDARPSPPSRAGSAAAPHPSSSTCMRPVGGDRCSDST
jgi:hypothetical protein